jgi:GT2 family glycosyltransferase
MNVTVVIPTRDQKERLRLVLCGLQGQSFGLNRFEILVVDDDCSDGTAGMVKAVAADGLPNLRLLKSSKEARGRSAARNTGLEEARGELVVFLDGDALPAPNLLEAHWEAYREHGPKVICCGLQYVLPELEYFQDPATGTLMQNVPIPSVMKDFLSVRQEQLVVTEEMVRASFDAIHSRACVGSYPNEGTQQRQDEARELLTQRPGSAAGWVAFIPHNGAVPMALLRQAGGFDEEIPFSEGWELAYRLQRQFGARPVPTDARSYHLYHHHPFDNPEGAREETQIRYRAVEYMAKKHGDPRLRLLYFWFAHLWSDGYIPDAAVVHDLFEFDRQYDELPDNTWDEYMLVLANHPSHFPLDAERVLTAEVGS